MRRDGVWFEVNFEWFTAEGTRDLDFWWDLSADAGRHDIEVDYEAYVVRFLCDLDAKASDYRS